MPLLAPDWAETRDIIYLIFAIMCLVRTKVGMRVALRIIRWSFKCLWIGKWPSHGPFDEFLNDPKAQYFFIRPTYTEIAVTSTAVGF